MNNVKWKVLTGISATLAVVAGIQYYHSEQRAELAASRELAAMLRADKAESELREARKLGNLIERAEAEKNSLRTAIADTEQHERERIAREALGVRLNEVVASSAGLRAAMAESYQTTLKWPANNREAGMPEPASYRQKSLQSATVMPDGVLSLQYLDAQGSTRHLLMRGKLTEAGTFHWQCSSADLADIHKYVPGCAFRPAR